MALVSQTFADTITCVRSTAGYTTNSSGVLTSVSANLPRFSYDPITLLPQGLMEEPARSNIVKDCADYSTANWTKTATTATAAAAVAPDGTTTASKIIADNGVTLQMNTNYMRCAATTTVISTVYTASVYAKAGEFNALSLRFGNNATVTSVQGACTFNLTNGTILSASAGYNAMITPAGNGWYRCSITGAAINTITYVGMWNSDTTATTGDGTSGIYVWGFQLETGEYATSLIYTSGASTASRSADSFTLIPYTWLNQTSGTIYFERVLNGLANNQTAFSLDNGTTDIESEVLLLSNTTNLITFSQQLDASAWTKTVATVSPNTIAAPDGTLTADTLTATASNGRALQTFTASAVAYTFSCYLKRKTGTGNVQLTVDGTTYATVAVDGTWTRFQTTLTPAAGSKTCGVRCVTSGDEVYVWGAQLELGSSATTYEPNPKYTSSYEIGTDGSIQTPYYAGIGAPNLYTKSAYAYATNDCTFYRGGTKVGDDTTVTLPVGLNRFVIGGSTLNAGREMNGYIRKVVYYPRRLTDAELAALTA